MKSIDAIFKNYDYKNKQDRSMEGILFLAAHIESYLEKTLEPFNITLCQYRILRQLRILYPEIIAISDLKEYLINKNGDASRMAERMARLGWIRKVSLKKDKRVTFVMITQQGLDLLQTIDAIENCFLNPLNTLTDEKSEQLNECLELMLRSFPN